MPLARWLAIWYFFHRNLFCSSMERQKITSSKKKTLKPKTARILAVFFLLTGIIMGLFDAPFLFDRFRESSLLFSSLRLSHTRFMIPYRLGLDLQGGTRLLYQADFANVASPDRGDSMEALRDVIERRINLFGVAEPVVRVENAGGEWRLSAELAGIKDVDAAIRLIGETPFLDFREERAAEERDKILEAQKKGERISEDPYFIPTSLTGRYLTRADITFSDTTFEPQVSLELTDEGAKIFADLTRRNVNKRIAIYLDGAPISAPVVREEITGGKAEISGNFTPSAAKELAGRLNAGALPVPIKLIGQQSVGASLGMESLAKSLRAGIIGFLAVAIFMILWYRLLGFVAVVALLLYTGIVLAIFKAIPVTLTAAGIAGFILSIGMAVDANILIFERMKEEFRSGKTLTEGIAEGFGRAWTSIRDSNVSSLITCAILYWFGTSIVQGFAFTLAIGILVSMISAISITRTFLVAIPSGIFSGRKRFLFMSGFSRN
jgi:protein-export membrane protein SecD